MRVWLENGKGRMCLMWRDEFSYLPARHQVVLRFPGSVEIWRVDRILGNGDLICKKLEKVIKGGV